MSKDRSQIRAFAEKAGGYCICETLANIEQEYGNYDAAIALYEKHIAERPDRYWSNGPRRALIDIYKKTGDKEKEFEQLQNLLWANVGDTDVFMEYKQHFSEDKWADEWDKILAKWGQNPEKLTGMTIIGRYLSKMRLKQWKDLRWADSERLEEENRQKKIGSLRAQGKSGDEIEVELSKDRTPPKPETLSEDLDPSSALVEIEDELTAKLDDDEKAALLLKWGRGYRTDEWLRLEQLYQDMMNSYDIQGAGQKDTLIMICKASLRANQLIDAGDIEGFQKAQKAYNDLMKSANLTAAQIKEKEKEGIDSVGELVALCEKEGFIPRYYVDTPNDKVDRVIQDMQEYVRDLVTGELGLENLIENAVSQIQRERQNIQDAAEDNGEKEEDELFSYETKPLEDQDFIDFQEAMEEVDEDES